MSRLRNRSKGGLRIVALVLVCWLQCSAQSGPVAAPDANETVKHLAGFSVVELRRYSIKEGECEHFARYFEAYFPEAMQQLGALVAGEFLERGHSVFTWIREFHNMDERAKANALLYYGPVWKEHRTLMNSMITDSDNVLLLRPLSPRQGVLVFPAVDPVREEKGAQGIVVAQIFRIQPNQVEDFAKQMEPVFSRYRALGVREAGVLVTLDASNNFPQLPVRNDGPYLVWLGITKSESLKDQLAKVATQAAQDDSIHKFLRGTPELLTLDPAPRSRLRWLPDNGSEAQGSR